MTPKEKAIQLYNMFYKAQTHPNSVEMREWGAKECALIAVDEIINLLKSGNTFGDRYYWQQVKLEIERNQNLDFLANQAQDLNLGY